MKRCNLGKQVHSNDMYMNEWISEELMQSGYLYFKKSELYCFGLSYLCASIFDWIMTPMTLQRRQARGRIASFSCILCLLYIILGVFVQFFNHYCMTVYSIYTRCMLGDSAVSFLGELTCISYIHATVKSVRISLKHIAWSWWSVRKNTEVNPNCTQ